MLPHMQVTTRTLASQLAAWLVGIKRDLETLNRRAMDVGFKLEKLAAGKAA